MLFYKKEKTYKLSNLLVEVFITIEFSNFLYIK